MNKQITNKYQSRKKNKQGGFTLVELAIAMVIIALLTAGILVGQNLIESATIKATISQIEEHQTSFNVFVDKYRAFPGDFAAADQFIGAANTEIGDGNTQVVWSDVCAACTGGEMEGPLAWRHLQLAGLTQGQFGTDLASGDATPNTVIPTSKIGGEGGGYYITYDTVGGLDNVLGIGLFAGAGTGINRNPYITPKQAFDIDRKLDDSNPTTGLVRAYPPADDTCISTTTGTYVLTSDSIACWMEYKLD